MFRPLPGLTIATLIALAVLIWLGSWQVSRRLEKHQLLDQIASRQSAPPAPIEYLFPTGDYAAFRAATARGVFEHTNEVYVFAARTDTGPTLPGFKVITPFRLLGGDIILVDRGWVSNEQRDPKTRAKGQPAGVVELEGSLRRSSVAAYFTPPPEPSARIFYVRDSAAIARLMGVSPKTPLIFEATTKTTGGPLPLPSTIDIPNNHLNYAITWFSLAIVMLIIYLRYHYTIGRLRLRS